MTEGWIDKVNYKTIKWTIPRVGYLTGVESGFDKNCGSGRGEVGTISSSASTSTVSRSVQEGLVGSFDGFLQKSSLVLIT